MSPGAQIDYDALAQQHGGSTAPIDYDALAAEHGGNAMGALAGATALRAPPKPFSGEWFLEKADRASDYLGAAGATIGALAGSVAGPGGAIAGAIGGGAAGESARELAQRALGTNYNVPASSAEAAKQIGKEGLIQGGVQAVTEGAGALARAAAPAMAESSLGVSAAMRGRGRTIGQAVLDQTTGIGPGKVSEQAAARVNELTGQLESAIDQATQQGKIGSSTPAHQVIDDAIRKTPRNATQIIDKLQSLRDKLDLRGSNAIGPMQTNFTPNDLLEMKRGIGKEIDVWPAEWKYNKDIVRAKMGVYGALDHEVDRLAPGTAEINQQISSLIPAIKQGAKEADQAGLVQNLAHRLGAHTGALAGAGIGGAFGYHKGGTEGAVLGSTIGLVAPELLSSPQAQMLGARMLVSPYSRIPLGALARVVPDYLQKPNRNEDNEK